MGRFRPDVCWGMEPHPVNPYSKAQQLGKRDRKPPKGPCRGAFPKPPVHDECPEFLDFLRARPCHLCALHGIRQFWATEAAHLESRRYGDKENALPLCGLHHRESPKSFHVLGRKGFAAAWKLNLKKLAREYWRLYRKAA